MTISRREFIQLMGLASAGAFTPASVFAAQKRPSDFYELPGFGNVCLMHMTDCHAQLQPIYFREPNVNIGTGESIAKPPHLVGEYLLKKYGIKANSMQAHALTYMNFNDAAQHYGKVGGFAHLATLVKQIRQSRSAGSTLLLDGGDTWQGSGTAYWTRGQDMVMATNQLGVDVMTGHWEFTYLEAEIRERIKSFKGDFVAQNIRVKEESLFDGAVAYDEETGHTFKPYTIKILNGIKIAIIGQAFPYTPIANPSRFIPDWTFGILEAELQALVNKIREKEKVGAVVVISHNGMDVDVKLASRVTGVNVIMGGHTHDAIPQPVIVTNTSGKTLVTNAGSNGKFLGVLDLDIKKSKVIGFRYRLVPIFSNLIAPDPAMTTLIDNIRKPYLEQLNEVLSISDQLLYRRGNFNGTFDQIICDGLRYVLDAEISMSPGFRWGTTVLPGQPITMENLMDQTAITYPETYVREMTGNELKLILEDVCDNLFNNDPYLRQGGDMVRMGGLDYVCDVKAVQGKRITNMQLDNGKKIEANKIYKVAGWASVGSQSTGLPIWDITAIYLKEHKITKLNKLNTPILKQAKGNPGISQYSGKISS